MKSYADSEPVIEAIASFDGTADSKGNQTTSDKRVLTALRRLIMDGSIPSGAKITEVGLSSLLKISRTPIRLALKTLEVEGLICKRDGRGYTVCDLDFDDLSKAYEVRGVLEGLAAPPFGHERPYFGCGIKTAQIAANDRGSRSHDRRP